MSRTDDRGTVGLAGEALACAELQRRGYEILATRVRCRHGELDIVARDGATVVFVEVKARRTSARGTAAEAVTPRKQRAIAGLAMRYLAGRGWTARPCRFDVVTVTWEGTAARVEVIQSAFDMPSSW